MQQNKEQAKRLNFMNMEFHAADIETFESGMAIDMVYTLHACDTATDKSIHLGIRNRARVILSVSCCQHSLSLKSNSLKAVIRHKAFRDKALMMVSDSMRALLLEEIGYKVGIFDFVSSRYTDKNTMLRARRTEFRKQLNTNNKYLKLQNEFGMRPYLEALVKKDVLLE